MQKSSFPSNITSSGQTKLFLQNNRCTLQYKANGLKGLSYMSVNVSQNAEQFWPKNNLDYHKQLVSFRLLLLSDN